MPRGTDLGRAQGAQGDPGLLDRGQGQRIVGLGQDAPGISFPKREVVDKSKFCCW